MGENSQKSLDLGPEDPLKRPGECEKIMSMQKKSALSKAVLCLSLLAPSFVSAGDGIRIKHIHMNRTFNSGAPFIKTAVKPKLNLMPKFLRGSRAPWMLLASAGAGLLASCVSNQQSGDDLKTWTFTSVETINKVENPYGTGPEMSTYKVEMDMAFRSGGFIHHSLEMTGWQLRHVLSHFGLRLNFGDQSKLKMKSFITSGIDSPRDAMDILIIQDKLGGKRPPIMPHVLYDRAAKALAQMKLPDFSGQDENYVDRVFSALFHKHTTYNLAKKVEEFSGGAVKMRQADAKTVFNLGVKGEADYLVLVSGENKKRLIFGPYPTPFYFDRN